MTTLLSANNYYYPRGGAETVFLMHNRLFEEQGFRVIPFCMRHPKNLPTPWERYFVDEIEFGSDYSLLQKVVRAPKVVYSMEARTRVATLLDEQRPALFHGHNIYNHISPSILGLLKSRGVPTVLTLHDLKIACPAYNMLAPDGVCERCKGGRFHEVVRNRCIKGSAVLSGLMMAEAYLHRALGSYTRSVDRFVVPSRFYIRKFVEWGFDEAKFMHVPNVVEASRFAPHPAPGDHFLYFGRLSPEKGLATLVRAAGLAGIALKLVGTGPQEAELRQLAATLGARVEFLGFRTGDALHAAVAACRAIVVPSEWYENAPMSILEAYALAKPVIGARIGGVPEMVEEGATGRTFTSGDAASLASVLGEMRDLPDGVVADMGRRGREWVERDFAAAAYVARMRDVYAGLGVASP